MGSAARLHRDNTWRSLQPTTLHGRVRSIGAEIPLRSTDTRVLPSLARVLTSSALASGMIICVAPNALVSASGILTAALSCEHHEHDKRHGDNYGDVERRQGHRRHGWPKRKGARAPRGVKRRGPSLHKETMPGRCFAITTGRRDLCRGTGAPALSKHAKDLWNHANPAPARAGLW
jgi:hypothetical protein